MDALPRPTRYRFDLERFGRDVLFYRISREIKLSDRLTDQTDVAIAQQSRIERGLCKQPSIDTIVRLAAWASLDISDYIMTY